MKIWCFPCLCFGEKEEDHVVNTTSNSQYFQSSSKRKEQMRGFGLERERGEMGNDDSELFWATLPDGRGGDEEEGTGLQLSDDQSEDFLSLVEDAEPRLTATGASGSQGLKVDVNLNLGLGAGPSTSSSATGREPRCLDTQNKRPKVHSLSLDWMTSFEHDSHYAAPSNETVGDESFQDVGVSGNIYRSNNDTVKMDDTELRMDLTDDLLHMVFSFLDHIDLCRAARVCKQWKDASSHEDFWRYLNFENRMISVQQFEDMCRRYPNTTGVNVYGTPALHPLAMKAVCSLRKLQVLTLGKGQLAETFFQALPDCHLLMNLNINDAMLGSGIQEIPIHHDGLRELQIVKCRVLRISIRCPLLEILSLKRSSMPHAVLNCPLLQSLDIASCHKLSDAAIRSAATSCPRLQSLDLSNCSCVSDETIREIATACVNLHVLDASYCPNISLESVRLTMLTVLKLHSCEGITSASMIAIASCYMLEVLELDNCGLLTSVSLDLERLKNIRLVHCRKFVDLNLRSWVLSAVTVSNCPSLQRISIASNALKKLVLQKQESLTTLSLQCHSLQELDLTECESLTNAICEVLSSHGGCPALRSLVLDSCESLTAVSLSSKTLVSLSLGGCRAITSLELNCPYLEHVSLDGCDHLERASFSPVGLRSLNLGICPKLNVLYVEAPQMVSLELKGCGVLSEAIIYCPRLTSLDASFCSQLKDECLSATTSLCPLIESLVLMSCPSVGPDGLSSLRSLPNLTYLDLSYTFLVNLQQVFDSCLYLKVLKLQACKYLSDTSLEPLYKDGALPALYELDLSYGTLCQSAIEELLAGCMNLTHVSLNGCINMHDLDWGFHRHKQSEMITVYENYEDQPIRLLENLNCVGCPNIKKVIVPPVASNCNSLEILKLNCPRLTSLFLQSCNVDEEVLVAAIVQCNVLETLDVRFCPKISPTSMVALRSACPSLKRIFSSFLTA
ncbi:F-box/LRR-repeat protein 15-like isoform X2 [Andrographis paniculata]|uniref:F-box/LRR-repeat protein 15-like isoform X2 n=1 Tax=Andrographis paniculata TaxID=175694 RepID=UPI0021E985AD|nr:F-box/LRR-repeat protein 15-like isoform X2 [Andrographis paniculata]